MSRLSRGDYLRISSSTTKSLPDLRMDYLQTASRVWVMKDVEGPEMDGAICEEDPLVPRFEGVEDDRCETLDLPVAECPPSQIEFPVVEFFDRAPKLMFRRVAEAPPNVLNPLVDCVKFVGRSGDPL